MASHHRRGRRVAALVLLAAAAPGPAEAQMFRTLFIRGAPDEPRPFGTVVSLEVHPADGRIRVVDDSARVHLFDRRGRRLDSGSAAAWPAPGAAETAAAASAARPGVEAAPGVRVAPTADSAGFRITWSAEGEVLDERAYGLPGAVAGGGPGRAAGGGDPEAGTAPGAFRVVRALAGGDGRAWLLVCPEGRCGEEERWLVVAPPPLVRGDAPAGEEPAATGGPPTLSWMVLPVRFRLEAVRGRRLYGVQGVPGRQSLHVMELYEAGA